MRYIKYDWVIRNGGCAQSKDKEYIFVEERSASTQTVHQCDRLKHYSRRSSYSTSSLLEICTELKLSIFRVSVSFCLNRIQSQGAEASSRSSGTELTLLSNHRLS